MNDMQKQMPDKREGSDGMRADASGEPTSDNVEKGGAEERASLPDLSAKREQEKKTLALMVSIYCKGRKHEGRASQGPGPRGTGICPRCQELVDYCFARIDACPHMGTKTFCSACQTHCYRKDMRARVKEAMAYAGPRMLFYDPAGAVRHLRYGRPKKRRS